MADGFLFPTESLRTRDSSGKKEVWDPVRKAWIAFTPEEFVRQSLIHYLCTEKMVPAGLISVEKQIRVHGMVRRYDLVVYSKNGNPLLLAECKAPDVPINQDAFDQAARYNIPLRVPYMLVTNGLKLYCCRISFDTEGVDFLSELPSFSQLTT